MSTIKNRRRTVYVYAPVGLDAWKSTRNSLSPDPGTLVVKTQPAGCPRNGTMGHCFIADSESGAFYGLVLEGSLQRSPRSPEIGYRRRPC